MKISPEATGGTVASRRLDEGQCRAWALPQDPSCAREARSLLAEALAALGVHRAAIADAQLMISELATNAHQHADDYGPHELWVSPAHDGPGGLACGVFDRLAGTSLPGYSWTSGDYGRGLTIVAELSAGRWGLVYGESRLDPRVSGKAVWFAVPARL